MCVRNYFQWYFHGKHQNVSLHISWRCFVVDLCFNHSSVCMFYSIIFCFILLVSVLTKASVACSYWNYRAYILPFVAFLFCFNYRSYVVHCFCYIETLLNPIMWFFLIYNIMPTLIPRNCAPAEPTLLTTTILRFLFPSNRKSCHVIWGREKNAFLKL